MHRPAVLQSSGAQPARAGLNLTAPTVAPAQYEIRACVWRRSTARWEDALTLVP